MLKSGLNSVRSGITRFLDQFPEPLVLRALQFPERSEKSDS
jgi:hypothetical protein